MHNPHISMVVKLMKIHFQAKIIIFSFLCGLLLFFGLLIQDLSMILLIVLFLILTGYFVFQRNIALFEPFTLFTLYYFTILPSVLYLRLINFENSIFINETSFSYELNFLLNISLAYYIIGYLFAFWGYKTFVRSSQPKITFDDGISLKIVQMLIVPFALIGIINFVYNIYAYADGNIFIYMQNISIRHLEFAEGGTTLGYLFGYMAAYLWLYVLLKQRKMSYLFILFLILTFLMKVSTGRIYGTVFFVMSFIGIYYIVSMKIDGEDGHKNIRYIFLLILMGVVGVIIYFFRVTSSLMYNEMVSSGWLDTIVQFVDFDKIMNFTVLRGNIPNIPIFMKIIDSWANDIGFLYGKSLFTWIYSIVPSSFRPEGYQPSVMIKNMWYTHIPGGALPPTGIGEMYANFGVLGPLMGMFMFGSFVALLKNLLFKFNNYWYLVIYVQIGIGFIMIYPKGEFDNLTLWYVVPILFTLFLIIVLQKSVCIRRGSSRQMLSWNHSLYQ